MAGRPSTSKYARGTREYNFEKRLRYYYLNGIVLPPTTTPHYAADVTYLTPLKNGYGYFGVLAYDQTGNYLQCHICGNFFQSLGQHTGMSHRLQAREYKYTFGLRLGQSLSGAKALANFSRGGSGRISSDPEAMARMRANLDGRRSGTTASRTWSLQRLNEAGRTKAQLLAQLKELATALGKTPARRQYFAYIKGDPRKIIYGRLFESYRDMCGQAGLSPNTKGGKAKQIAYEKETINARTI